MSFDGIPIRSRELVFLDAETSGLDSVRHEITELAAIRITADLKEEKIILHRKCRMQWPERASGEALAVNGYSAAAWANAYPIRVALVDLATTIDSSVVVWGHNVHFDLDFLREAYARESLPMPAFKYALDTMTLAWPLAARGYVDKLALDALCSKYGISNEGKHTALADVRRTIALYKKLMGIR
jgi:DNA polymerase III alpha subunit (gram-positive type)